MDEKENKSAKRIAALAFFSVAGYLLSAAAEKLLSGRARIRSEKISGDVYIIGKNPNPKAVCITNVSLVNFVKNVIIWFQKE